MSSASDSYSCGSLNVRRFRFLASPPAVWARRGPGGRWNGQRAGLRELNDKRLSADHPPLCRYHQASRPVGRPFGRPHGLSLDLTCRGINRRPIGLIERFFRSLKEECVWQHLFSSFAAARRAIAAWIRWYNDAR